MVVEQPIPVLYNSVKLEVGFRADLIVERRVVVETKSVEALSPVHSKVLLTYLRLTDIHLGLLINFNVELIKNGIRRVVNNLPESVRTPHAELAEAAEEESTSSNNAPEVGV